MANFALINKSNIVIAVIALSNNKLLINNVESEQLGIDFLNNDLKIKVNYPECFVIKQTSYNGNFRNKFSGIGDKWHEEIDAFVTKPFPSWILNLELKAYEAPVQKPGENYIWNEEKMQWEEIKLNNI